MMPTSFLERMYGTHMENKGNNREVFKPMESSADTYATNLVFNDVSIRINSHRSFVDNTFEKLKDAITGMEIDEKYQHVDGIIEYIVGEDINISYLSDEQRLIITGPIRMFGNGTSIAFTAHYMAECLRADKSGLMLVHSAAVKLPEQDKSYVFLGEKGVGKTTLALRLCHQYGYSLIGNDQVYMGSNDTSELITESGNAWFNVRETAISADPYIARLLAKPQNLNKPSWNNKITVLPESIGVSTCERQLLVKEVFHVRIDHSQPDLLAMAWHGLQRNLILHERFGRHITGQATPFQDDYGNYLGSLPPVNLEAALKARDKLVSLVIKTGVTEIFSPDSDSAVDFIHAKENE